MSPTNISLKELREAAFASSENVIERLDKVIDVYDKYYSDNEANFDDRTISEALAQDYADAIAGFWSVRAVEAANLLLLHGWHQFADWQLRKDRRVSRATIFNQLTAIHLHILNDLGTATWWGLHTHADEILGGQTNGAGKADLHTRLGVSNEALEALTSIAKRNRDKVEGSWSRKEGFAEEAVREFAVKYPEYSYILGQSSLRAEFPLARSYYRILLKEFSTAQSVGKNETDKKETFERLASYLFLLLPGCVPRKNVKDMDSAFETDLVIRNLNPNSNLMAEVFGRYYVAECKNKKVKVGVSDVGYFLHRIRLMHTSFGVLFAKKGITGDGKEERAARQLIRRSFHEDKTICVVLALPDLERLDSDNTTFRSLLFELSEQFRFGNP